MAKAVQESQPIVDFGMVQGEITLVHPSWHRHLQGVDDSMKISSSTFHRLETKVKTLPFRPSPENTQIPPKRPFGRPFGVPRGSFWVVFCQTCVKTQGPRHVKRVFGPFWAESAQPAQFKNPIPSAPYQMLRAFLERATRGKREREREKRR